jgi:hypothetical protein
LHGHQADPAGRAVNEHRVTSGHLGRRQQMERGRAGEHQAGRLLPAQPGGLRNQRLGGDGDLAGVGAVHPECDHLVADPDRSGRPDRIGADRGHDAGGFEAEPLGQLGGIGAERAAVGLDVGRVHPGRANAERGLARARRRRDLVDERQDLGLAVLRSNHHSRHGGPTYPLPHLCQRREENVVPGDKKLPTLGTRTAQPRMRFISGSTSGSGVTRAAIR